MDYAKVLIIDTNIEIYEYSISIWAEYSIKTHRVDNIEKALKEISVYKYHLIIIVECKEQRPYVLDSIKLFREMTIAPIVIASTDSIDPEYRINGLDTGADEVWEMPELIEVAVAKGNAIIRRYLQLNKEIDKQSTIIVNKHIVLSVAQRLVTQQFDVMRTWADMYDECEMETKKMILSRIMQSVKVSRNYEIEIDFTVDFEQIGGQAHLGSITESCAIFPDKITQKAVSF